MSSRNSIKKRKLHKDCFDLDYSFFIWLKEHLNIYLQDASKIVNLNYHIIQWKDKKYTQEELIKVLRTKVDQLLVLDGWDEGYWDIFNDTLDIWKLLLPYMWW